ncbi:hypothetical protein QYE76_046982 [Lolium multiflorum]|uniref:DUF4283 domain-containing protein n=1 Tax=Lolium multiflorum TaxID=4521 RepID=A0AAD8WZP9_LOLMU|nr:hypothetical protein QYE76_046982 [Lolium multiflorum]
MEKVEGLMKNLKLSAAENKSLKIGWTDGLKTGEVEVKALGKLLSEKPPYIEGIHKSLGRIWCPLKGIKIKEMGDNLFMFTFLQPSGKRKALDEGPWMFDKELMVMQDFDPTKSLEDYEFNDIPIWACSVKLKKGEKQQYGIWLKAVMEGREAGGSSQRWKEMGGNGGTRRGSSFGFGSKNRLSGSDSDSWRVSDKDRNNSRTSGGSNAEKTKSDQEATSPLKLPPPASEGKGNQRRLEFSEGAGDVEGKKGCTVVSPVEETGVEAQQGAGDKPAMHGPTVGGTSINNPDILVQEGRVGDVTEDPKGEEGRKSSATTRRLRGGKNKNRERKAPQTVAGQIREVKSVGGKRPAEEGDMELDDREIKKCRNVEGMVSGEGVADLHNEAGLSEQPCGKQ